MYPSHYRIMKYVSFESIHYAIYLNTISFSKVFSKFDYVFSSNLLII